MSWLKERDRNSIFFHFKASNRRQHIKITTLQNDEGAWLEGQHLDNLIVENFITMFSASGVRSPMEFLSSIDKRMLD